MGLATKAGYVFIGSTASINAIKSNKAKAVITGTLSQNTLNRLESLCNSNNIALFPNQQEILDVIYPSGAIKLIALKNNGLTDKIITILNNTFGGIFNS